MTHTSRREAVSAIAREAARMIFPNVDHTVPQTRASFATDYASHITRLGGTLTLAEYAAECYLAKVPAEYVDAVAALDAQVAR